MAMNGYSTTPRSLKSESHNKIQFNVIARTHTVRIKFTNNYPQAKLINHYNIRGVPSVIIDSFHVNINDLHEEFSLFIYLFQFLQIR